MRLLAFNEHRRARRQDQGRVALLLALLALATAVLVLLVASALLGAVGSEFPR